MSRPATKKAWRLRALLQIALAFLLAINGVLAGFGAGAGAAIVRNCRCRSFFVAEGCHWKRPLAALAFCTAIGLGGCLEWEKPEATLTPPQQFREVRPKSTSPIPSARDFAMKFNSKELTSLVAQAVEENLDIAAAVARIREDDAQARRSSHALWPSLSMTDFAQRQQVPGTTVIAISGTPNSNPSATFLRRQGTFSAMRFNLFQLGLNAGYEIDFWGKNEDASESARMLANASRFDRDVVEISITAAVLNAYFQVLSAQDRLRIVHNNVKKAETVYTALQARLKANAATVLDTSQQGAVLAEVRAMIPPLEETLRQTKNLLAVLVGRTPESLNVQGGSLRKLVYQHIEPGLPSEVLLRRPDVAEAEAMLASQEYSVLQARADFFPSITLTGQYGVQSVLLTNLLSPQAIAWLIGPNLAQPLFDGYRLQGQYEWQKGAYAERSALYRKQILTALLDTENALIAVRETGQQLKLQAVAVAEGRRAFDAAVAQLGAGLIDVVTLTTTETVLFRDEDLMEQVRLAHFQAATNLYQALGGGWSPTTRENEIARASESYEADKGPWP